MTRSDFAWLLATEGNASETRTDGYVVCAVDVELYDGARITAHVLVGVGRAVAFRSESAASCACCGGSKGSGGNCDNADDDGSSSSSNVQTRKSHIRLLPSARYKHLLVTGAQSYCIQPAYIEWLETHEAHNRSWIGLLLYLVLALVPFTLTALLVLPSVLFARVCGCARGEWSLAAFPIAQSALWSIVGCVPGSGRVDTSRLPPPFHEWLLRRKEQENGQHAPVAKEPAKSVHPPVSMT